MCQEEKQQPSFCFNLSACFEIEIVGRLLPDQQLHLFHPLLHTWAVRTAISFSASLRSKNFKAYQAFKLVSGCLSSTENRGCALKCAPHFYQEPTGVRGKFFPKSEHFDRYRIKIPHSL